MVIISLNSIKWLKCPPGYHLITDILYSSVSLGKLQKRPHLPPFKSIPTLPTLLHALRSKRYRSLTSVANVRTPQALILQSTGDCGKVLAIHSAECHRMFPWQPQLLQLTAQCLRIYTMTSRGCQHKQQCCHTCLNLTRLCNTIQVPSDFKSLVAQPECLRLTLKPFNEHESTSNQHKLLPYNHLNVILSHFFLILMSDCFQKHILANMLSLPSRQLLISEQSYVTQVIEKFLII